MFIPFPEVYFRPSNPLAVIVVVAPAFFLPLRRRWPVSVLALVVVCYGVAALTGTLSPGTVLAAAIAMFGVATHATRRTTFVVAGLTVLAIVFLSLLAAISSVTDPRIIQFAIFVAFAAAAGDAGRSRREYIIAITERAERAEQTRDAEASRRVAEERLKIARDLHDAVAHQISVISLNAGVASSALETRPEKAKAALGTIRSASRTVLGEIGNLLEVLRAEDSEGVTAPQLGLAHLDDLVAQFAADGLDVKVRLEGDPGEVTGAVDLVAYRVIHEGLTNAHKHGAEHRAHVLIEVREDQVLIVVTNPVLPPADSQQGRGVTSAGGGHGLLGIRERVSAVRGAVEAGPMPGGFRIAATLPLAKENV